MAVIPQVAEQPTQTQQEAGDSIDDDRLCLSSFIIHLECRPCWISTSALAKHAKRIWGLSGWLSSLRGLGRLTLCGRNTHTQQTQPNEFGMAKEGASTPAAVVAPTVAAAAAASSLGTLVGKVVKRAPRGTT